MRPLFLGAALAAALAAPAPAQNPAPAPAPAPAAAPAGKTRPGARLDTATVAFDTGGVHVILRRNSANNVVAVNLYLLGGTQLVTQANAGIETFLLMLSERGTAKYPRETLRRKTAALGSAIVVEPRDDWTMFGFRGVRATFDSTWALWADRLTAGTLDTADIEFLRTQVLTAVQQRQDSPDGLVHDLADSARYAGMPYSVPSTGNEQSVASFTAAQLADWRRTKFITSRMLLVVVGNVDRERVAALAARTFGKLPRGDYKWAPPASAPVNTPASPVLVQRPLPTNYLLGYYVGPPASNAADATALRIATAVLSGRLFSEIRSRRNLTYDVDAPFNERAVTDGGLYVTTVYPDSTLQLMYVEQEYLKRNLVEPENLDIVEEQFITEFYLKNETNAEQANQLAQAQVYRGDYRYADRFVLDIHAVTPLAVQYVAQKYMRGFVWA
ncbi:MAG TPA: pitrilysin family protein, partial [Gemmatimonadaceae bacterium]|nr:pitrilysin family protein [Gemmatimonadaceae bacterium]